MANERLTSTGGLEFDYIPDAKCSRVRFHFTLYDDQNILRGATDDAKTYSLTPHQVHHVTLAQTDLSPAVEPSSTWFVVAASCGG